MTKAPVPNVALLRAVREQIGAHPETWSQQHWRCGTTLCFAGWAAQLAGGEWLTDSHAYGKIWLSADPQDNSAKVWAAVDERPAIHVADRAKRVLGLDGYQARALFTAARSLPAIDRVLTDIYGDAR